MKHSILFLTLLIVIVVLSCKTENENNSTISNDLSQSRMDSMQLVNELPIHPGAVISEIPITVIKRISTYDKFKGQDMYIFKGPDKRVGGEFYPDQQENGKVGAIHILNPYLMSKDGVYPGMNYKELMKISGLKKQGSETEKSLDFVKGNVTYRFDFPAKQLKFFKKEMEKLKVTRLIYK